MAVLWDGRVCVREREKGTECAQMCVFVVTRTFWVEVPEDGVPLVLLFLMASLMHVK